MHARVRQHMREVLSDSRMESRGAPAHEAFQRALRERGVPAQASFVETLFNAEGNRDLVKGFMENALCVDAAKGVPAALDAYKNYAAQDFFYLANYVKFKVLRLLVKPDSANKTASAEKDDAEDIKGDTDDAVSWYNTCSADLGIDMAKKLPNKAVKEYNKSLLDLSQSENWFSLHVILIACNYGWAKLALSLFDTADRTTDFWKFWLRPNVDWDENHPEIPPKMPSWALEFDSFLTTNAAHYASQLQHEDNTRLFRDGLILEIGLFNSVYKRGAA
ncbi:hypothetical protein AURDEDRAFT_160927 [Auricularia subglabra TFB-10046 SS5]|nr:hypothetical protein AURDEDRAFT_160927 [Auricularia subglabra TFB-10046 SS5]